MNNILTNIQQNELKYDTLNNNIENKQLNIINALNKIL